MDRLVLAVAATLDHVLLDTVLFTQRVRVPIALEGAFVEALAGFVLAFAEVRLFRWCFVVRRHGLTYALRGAMNDVNNRTQWRWGSDGGGGGGGVTRCHHGMLKCVRGEQIGTEV